MTTKGEMFLDVFLAVRKLMPFEAVNGLLEVVLRSQLSVEVSSVLVKELLDGPSV